MSYVRIEHHLTNSAGSGLELMVCRVSDVDTLIENTVDRSSHLELRAVVRNSPTVDLRD